MRSPESENFFSKAVRDAMEKHHFNQAQVAEHLRVDPAYISRWLKGSSPRIDQMLAVLRRLGWNMERARPEYNPFDDALQIAKARFGDTGSAKGSKKKDGELTELLRGAEDANRRSVSPPVTHTGSLDSVTGNITFREEDTSKELDTVFGLFPTLTFASRELTYLTVSGNGLSPAFHDGARVLLRRVTKPDEVPDGTIAIFETARRPAAHRVRRLVRVIDDRDQKPVSIIGAPLTETQDFLFFRPRDARLHSIVVGQLQLY